MLDTTLANATAHPARCALDHTAPAVWRTLRYDGLLEAEAPEDDTLECRTCLACRRSFSLPVSHVAAFNPPPQAADAAPFLTWSDVTSDMVERGFPQLRSRYYDIAWYGEDDKPRYAIVSVDLADSLVECVVGFEPNDVVCVTLLGDLRRAA